MFTLTFTNDTYGTITLPFYKAYISNYNPSYRYFGTENKGNDRVEIYDDTDMEYYLKQVKDVPTYAEVYELRTELYPLLRTYKCNEINGLELKVHFQAISNTSVVYHGVKITFRLYSVEHNTNVGEIAYITPQPQPYYSSGLMTTGGVYSLCYDHFNKEFFSLQPHYTIIKDMGRLTGYYQDYGDSNTILVKSIPYKKGDFIQYGKYSKHNGKDMDANYRIKYGTHMDTMITMPLTNYTSFFYKSDKVSLYTILQRASDDTDNDFHLEDGTEKDPNDDDSGSHKNPDYDKDKGGDGNHDDSSDKIPEDDIPSISGTSNGLITAWNVSPSQLESLAKELWSPNAIEAIHQYFTNPMGSILGLSIIPTSPSGSSGTIHLGGYNTGISATKITTDYKKVDLGSIPITRYYGSYLDYAPFTKISLILPYVGEIDIDPDQVMQKTLSVSYHINCVTGEFCAYVLADGDIISTQSGNCAKQLPICQTDFSSIISATIQVATTAMTAGASLEAQAALTGLSSSVAASEKASQTNRNFAASTLGSVLSAKPHYKHSSQLGTSSGQLGPQTPYLIITRPNLDLADNYKSFVGYPSNKNKLISQCIGFTQIEASNLSLPSATLEEVSEIKQLLLKGVIV